MLLGNKTNRKTFTKEAYVILSQGQSNDAGRGQWERMAGNEDYNYKGIGDVVTGFPAVRGSREKYIANPAGIYIYNRGTDITQNYAAPGGAWEPIVFGGNSRTDANTAQFFGPELMAVRIKDLTGKDVYVIKTAIGATPLSKNALGLTARLPWNNYWRQNAFNGYIKPALTSLFSDNPTTKFTFLGEFWKQGEADAEVNLNAEYTAQFLDRDAYVENCVKQFFSFEGARTTYKRIVASIDYKRTPAEADINAQMAALATSQPNKYSVIDCSQLGARKMDLTTAQAAPIAKGTPNSTGGTDDEHDNYIRIQMVSERAADIFLASLT